MEKIRRDNLPQTVERALDVLETLVESGRPLGNTAISQMVGLNRSTTYRIVQVLTNRGFLSRNNETNQYQLSYKILQMAGTLLNQINLRAVARQHLEKLAKETSQTAQLAMFEHGEVIFVDQVAGVDIFQLRLQIGMRVDLHCTAAGKSILAFMNEKEMNAYLGRGVFPRFTSKTITSKKLLMDELDKIRKSGYSFCDGEFHKEVRAVGAPILGSDTTIKGAVVLTIPTIKMKLREIAFFGNKVRMAAEQISLEIGGGRSGWEKNIERPFPGRSPGLP